MVDINTDQSESVVHFQLIFFFWSKPLTSILPQVHKYSDIIRDKQPPHTMALGISLIVKKIILSQKQ